jgi:Tol biopolymer transport system component/tRNA A-37 threonylcarbamoyl transferase component Bud32
MTATDRLAAALADRYRIERELGQGGMATVYLAEDLKHDRKVAVKVLRPELAAVLGADRFVQEIKTTAQLQHPHILPLFDSGSADGFLYYVMPYIEGETLRDKLNRDTQLSIDEAVRITSEVADALDYAHRHGVVHRDIKPENILLHDGRPMVADFGIALALSAAAGGRMTETGMSLGTPHYMSPEQATADKDITGRSDIYSLAAVLYEMLTGEPPHMGNSAQQIIMKIVTDQARPVTELRKSVPPNVAAALSQALEKLPADRFDSAKAFAEALTNPGFTTAMAASSPGARAARSRLHDPVFLAVAAVAVLALVGVAILARPKAKAAGVPPITFVMATTDSTRPIDNFPWPAAISPNGGTIVYAAIPPGTSGALGTSHLYFVRTNQLDAREIPGTAGAAEVYFSPDGQWVGFEADGKERKVRLDGSAPVTIAQAGAYNGSSWTVGNEILLGSWGPFTGISRVSAAGGTPVAVTHADTAKGERNHLWPLSTPDGKKVIFTIWYGGLASAQLAIASIKDGVVTPLGIKAIRPLAVLDGMLVYVKEDGAVMAVGLDIAPQKVRGSPIPVHDPVEVVPALNGNSEIYISQGGALITSIGSSTGTLSWISRSGAASTIRSTPEAFQAVQLSPDQHRVAVVVSTNGQSDVWIEDLTSGTFSRLTTINTVTSASWAPDAADVIYLAADEGGNALWRQAASGGIASEKILEIPHAATDAIMSPDGKSVLITAAPGDVWKLERLALDSGAALHDYLVDNGNVHAPDFSPDGRWVALVSDESGQDEIYVRSYPDPSSKLQVSIGGGEAPVWSADGSRVYYTSGTALIEARLSTKPAITLIGRDTAVAQFVTVSAATGYFSSPYHPARDGQRFLTAIPVHNSYRLVVSPNWITEFRRRVAESRSGR